MKHTNLYNEIEEPKNAKEVNRYILVGSVVCTLAFISVLMLLILNFMIIYADV